MSSLSATITQACTSSGGVLTISQADAAPGAGPDLSYSWVIRDSTGVDYGDSLDPSHFPQDSTALPNETYTVRVTAVDGMSGVAYNSIIFNFTIACAAAGSGALQLDSLTHTNETVALHDGSATIAASGGTAPLTATITPLGLTQAGSPATFTALEPGTYPVRMTDNAGAYVEGDVTIAPYTAPITGCLDEYADNYDAAATVGDFCAYTPVWRSAWGRNGVAVAVPALVGQVKAYTTALLRIGFRPGHQLAVDRPYGVPIVLRATVGPDGYAVFRLGPALRSALGASITEGRRLDLNSSTAATDDLFVGYELRRTTGELLEYGYALNAAVPDVQLFTGALLTPFRERLPIWPGFDDYAVSMLSADPLGRFAAIETQQAEQLDTVTLPCPANPLPVAWLAPQGGFGYWVFTGRPALGDTVADGQRYNEATTGESRYSSRGETRRTVAASSGYFKGVDLLDGLRTLLASPQVWYRPDPAGPWVAVTLEPGSFPAGRMGINRQQVSISFTEAQAQDMQGQ